MTSNHPDHMERNLAQAHLLITRGEFAEARALVARLRQAGVPQQDTQPLLDEIDRREETRKETAERQRDMRYYLGLQTTARRIGWFLAAIVGAVYGIWSGSIAIQRGIAQGFATVITTMEHSRSGTYPWTRPIYLDLIFAALWLSVSAIVMGVIVWASRDAEQWEETDVRSSSRYDR